MPMNPNPPTGLPLPPRDADVTLLQHGTLPPTARGGSQPVAPLPDLPNEAPATPRIELPTVDDRAGGSLSLPLRRETLPADRRPPLVATPGPNTNSTLAGHHQTVLPPEHDPEAWPAAENLIETFRAGDHGHPVVAQKPVAAGPVAPPPGKLLRHGPPAPLKSGPLRPVPPAPPVAPPLPSTAQQPALQPHVLPLQTEHVVALVLEHRRRLSGLDTWTRVLETAAVLAGVGALLEAAVGTLPVAGGLLLAAIALAAQATTLRHVAHTSAQVSALLDALSGTRDGASR